MAFIDCAAPLGCRMLGEGVNPSPNTLDENIRDVANVGSALRLHVLLTKSAFECQNKRITYCELSNEKHEKTSRGGGILVRGERRGRGGVLAPTIPGYSEFTENSRVPRFIGVPGFGRGTLFALRGPISTIWKVVALLRS